MGNLAPVHFAANVFSLPLKTDSHPTGVYTEHELYMVLATMFIYLSSYVDPMKVFALQIGGQAMTQQLAKIVDGSVKGISGSGLISGLKSGSDHGPLKDYGSQLVKKLHEGGMGVEEITWSQILPTTGALVTNQGQVVSLLFSQTADQKHG